MVPIVCKTGSPCIQMLYYVVAERKPGFFVKFKKGRRIATFYGCIKFEPYTEIGKKRRFSFSHYV